SKTQLAPELAPRRNKKTGEFGKLLKGMVGLEGIEPPTNGLGNRCSILLSYRPVRCYRLEQCITLSFFRGPNGQRGGNAHDGTNSGFHAEVLEPVDHGAWRLNFDQNLVIHIRLSDQFASRVKLGKKRTILLTEEQLGGNDGIGRQELIDLFKQSREPSL